MVKIRKEGSAGANSPNYKPKKYEENPNKDVFGKLAAVAHHNPTNLSFVIPQNNGGAKDVFSFGPEFSSEMEDAEGTTAIVEDGVGQLTFEENCRRIFSDANNKQWEAMRFFRGLLSKENNPPIDVVVGAGLIPRFVQFLDDDNQRVSSPSSMMASAVILE